MMASLCSAFVAFLVAASSSAALPSAPPPVKVASLSLHSSTAWTKESNCSATPRSYVECNLKVYTESIAIAAAEKAALILFPEGYGLAALPGSEFFGKPTGFYEPLISAIGSSPCGAAVAPQQATLSCSAATHKIAVASNVFVSLPNGTRRITQIVFDETGVVRSVYHKHYLFGATHLGEDHIFTPGPNTPTTFDLLGRRWGVLICYEGLRPFLLNDWTQPDALRAHGADTFLWSIGGGLPLASEGPQYVEKYSVSLVGSSVATAAFISSPGHHDVAPQRSVPISVEGYTASNASVVVRII